MSSKMALASKEIDFERLVETITEVVLKLLNPEGVKIGSKEWHSLFEDIYRVSTTPTAPEVEVPRFCERMSDLLKKHIEGELTLISEVPRGDFLLTYRTRFNTFCSGLEFIDMGFFYLYRTEEGGGGGTGALHDCSGAGPRPTIKTQLEVGMRIWRELIFDKFKSDLAEEIQTVVLRDREGDVADITSANQAVSSFSKMVVGENAEDTLALYREHFETGFLEQTETYYTRETNRLVETLSAAEYLITASQRLKDEVVRSSRILHESSTEPVDAVLNRCFIVAHREMIETEFRSSLETEGLRSLRLAHGLMKRVEIDMLKRAVEEHVIARGTQQVSSLDSTASTSLPVQFTEALSELHSKYRALIDDAFDGELQFVAALDAGCRAVVNKPIPRGGGGDNALTAPDLLAKYCDLFLKRSKHFASDAEIEEKMNALIVIFQYVDDKDIFQKFYSKMLAKRLIHATSASDEAEGAMISKLKQCCGYEYTSKLHQMFTDTSLSTELNVKFAKTEHGRADRRFKVVVLQSGAWPLGGGPRSTVQLAPALEKSVRAFELFYHSQHSGRKLNWLHHLSSGDVVCHTDSSRYEFAVTTFQMVILMLFNEADSCTVDTIQSSTNLSERELYRTVRSLIATKLLIADPALQPEGEIPGDCTIRFNSKFKSRKKRMRLSAAVQRESTADTKRTVDSVDEDRKSLLQIAIVRIMKSRKVLSYRTLVDEVIRMVAARFKPTVLIIKKCIEDLIAMEYLERSADDTTELRYLA